MAKYGMLCPTEIHFGASAVFYIYIYIYKRPTKSAILAKFFYLPTTNFTGLNCSVESFNQDLEAINKWLILNKLSLNMDKMLQGSESLKCFQPSIVY